MNMILSTLTQLSMTKRKIPLSCRLSDLILLPNYGMPWYIIPTTEIGLTSKSPLTYRWYLNRLILLNSPVNAKLYRSILYFLLPSVVFYSLLCFYSTIAAHKAKKILAAQEKDN